MPIWEKLLWAWLYVNLLVLFVLLLTSRPPRGFGGK